MIPLPRRSRSSIQLSEDESFFKRRNKKKHFTENVANKGKFLSPHGSILGSSEYVVPTCSVVLQEFLEEIAPADCRDENDQKSLGTRKSSQRCSISISSLDFSKEHPKIVPSLSPTIISDGKSCFNDGRDVPARDVSDADVGAKAGKQFNNNFRYNENQDSYGASGGCSNETGIIAAFVEQKARTISDDASETCDETALCNSVRNTIGLVQNTTNFSGKDDNTSNLTTADELDEMKVMVTGEDEITNLLSTSVERVNKNNGDSKNSYELVAKLSLESAGSNQRKAKKKRKRKGIRFKLSRSSLSLLSASGSNHSLSQKSSECECSPKSGDPPSPPSGPTNPDRPEYTIISSHEMKNLPPLPSSPPCKTLPRATFRSNQIRISPTNVLNFARQRLASGKITTPPQSPLVKFSAAATSSPRSLEFPHHSPSAPQSSPSGSPVSGSPALGLPVLGPPASGTSALSIKLPPSSPSQVSIASTPCSSIGLEIGGECKVPKKVEDERKAAEEFRLKVLYMFSSSEEFARDGKVNGGATSKYDDAILKDSKVAMSRSFSAPTTNKKKGPKKNSPRHKLLVVKQNDFMATYSPVYRNSINVSYMRLSRQVRIGRTRDGHPISVMPTPLRAANMVKIHVYDLIDKDTLMRVPMGCLFPIGKVFKALNSGLHTLGIGAYHCGIEVNGIEYAYGANDEPGESGVFTCVPKRSPNYTYRTTIDFGMVKSTRPYWISVPAPNSSGKPGNGKQNYIRQKTDVFVDGFEIMRDMSRKWYGVDYDLLRKNCCTFARDSCLEVGIETHKIPTWFTNLAETGVVTEDALNSLDERLVVPFKRCVIADFDQLLDMEEQTAEGFEVITKRKRGSLCGLVAVDVEETEATFLTNLVFDDENSQGKVNNNETDEMGVKNSFSWAY